MSAALVMKWMILFLFVGSIYAGGIITKSKKHALRTVKTRKDAATMIEVKPMKTKEDDESSSEAVASNPVSSIEQYEPTAPQADDSVVVPTLRHFTPVIIDQSIMDGSSPIEVAKMKVKSETKYEFHGGLYVGSIIKGVPRGNGYLIYNDAGISIAGVWDGDTVTGTISYEDGRIQTGKLSLGGSNKVVLAPGFDLILSSSFIHVSRYEYKSTDDLYSGVYTGYMSFGEPQGNGELVSPKWKFVGEFLHGFKSGTLNYSNDPLLREYTGNFVHNVPHGYGVMTFVNGCVFEGSWIDGLRDHGEFHCEGYMYNGVSKPKVYVGSFQNNVPHGSGIMCYPDGCVFDGLWADGLPHEGILSCKEYTYNGTFMQDLVHGKGIYTNIRLNWTYIGDFEHGVFHGRGKKIYYSTGCVFDGNWVKGDRINGVLTCKEFTYEGEFKGNVFHGHGKKIYYSTGCVFDGNWVNGDRINGVFTCKKFTYEGEFKGTVFHGHGCITYKDGYQFKGEWFQDQMLNGQITFTVDNYIRSYIGPIKDGFIEGDGEVRYSNGDSFKGIFLKGKKQHGLYRFSNGDSYDGYFKDDVKISHGVFNRHDGVSFNFLDPDLECSICLGPYNRAESLQKLSCKHIFHKDCIEDWFSSTSTGKLCPYCNQASQKGTDFKYKEVPVDLYKAIFQ